MTLASLTDAASSLESYQEKSSFSEMKICLDVKSSPSLIENDQHFDQNMPK